LNSVGQSRRLGSPDIEIGGSTETEECSEKDKQDDHCLALEKGYDGDDDDSSRDAFILYVGYGEYALAE
jgi:hypothetical protein